MADNDGPTINADFSVSWGEIVSVGMNIGLVSNSTSVSGIIINFPASNNYYQVQLKKTYEFQRHKVDVYQYDEYKYTYYTTVTKHLTTEGVLVKI